jgi:hypothetical protein
MADWRVSTWVVYLADHLADERAVLMVVQWVVSRADWTVSI